jgi:hypothetical protein
MSFSKITAIFLLLVCLFSFKCQAEPRLINHTRGDLTNTTLELPFIALTGGLVLASYSYYLDDEVQEYFEDHPFSRKFDDIGNWVGNPYILSSASVLMYGSSLLTKNENFQRTSETLVEALIFNFVITEGIKLSFRRTRPNGGNYSFPSGHTSTAFTIAAVLQNMEGWKYGVPAYVAASAIGFSRIDGGYHYLSDVVFGAALGATIGWGTSLFHQKENTKLMISPILDQTRGLMLSYKF